MTQRSPSRRTVLLTGGAGYLGGAVADLIRRDAIVYDNLMYCDEYLKPVRFVRADVTDYDTLWTYLKAADAVIWLAAIVGDAACALRAEEAIRTNVGAVRFLAENYDRRIVFVSTCSVYGVADELLTEESETHPLSLYAETKLNAERYLRDKDSVILRLATLHGVGERLRFDLVVNGLAFRAASTGKITLFGGGQWRPLLHLKDAAASIVKVLWSGQAGVYNLHAENYRVREIAEAVKREIPGVATEVTESAFEDKRSYRVSSERAREVLSLHPQRGMVETIRRIRDLVHDGRIKDGANMKYFNARALSGGRDGG